jgi:hypothetical protein
LLPLGRPLGFGTLPFSNGVKFFMFAIISLLFHIIFRV